MLLKVEDLKVSYGQVKALLGVSIEIGEGEIVSIIGANGAGKSTLMKAIMGDVKAQSGKVLFQGTELGHVHTHRIVKDGIVYVPEGRQVFAKLSVQDNLEMGAFCRSYSKAEMNKLYEECYEMFPILKKRRRQLAGSLSGGEQQMLALCRGLMSQPKLMLLDEPSLGRRSTAAARRKRFAPACACASAAAAARSPISKPSSARWWTMCAPAAPSRSLFPQWAATAAPPLRASAPSSRATA